jgi:IS605 OrfB family transposase
MQQIITAKLKLQANPEQFRALRHTQLAYRDALNHVSRYAFAHGKMSNQHTLQQACYDDIRQAYHLPAQMACNVPRQVGATYKALWTRAKTNADARQAGLTKRWYKGLDHAPEYVSPTLTYNYQRDFSFKTEQQVSILTLGGRAVVPYTGYTRHVALIRRGAQIGAAKLWYDKPHKQFYLLVSLEVEITDPMPQTHRGVVGVDVGQRYLAVATDMQNRTVFYSGKQIQAKAEHYVRLRKRLQQKGTRAATRRLIVLAGRERRLKQDRNHLISRRIVDAYPASVIGLEDLTDIRERTGRKRGKRTSAKRRRANGHVSKWAFGELQRYLIYKASLAGSKAVKVDAYCTSQACPRCGHTGPENRPAKGLLFMCRACGLQLHADLVGARNIALRTLLARQIWANMGVLSERPDVSGNEAKAVWRQRYAELRWSPDTSSQL